MRYTATERRAWCLTVAIWVEASEFNALRVEGPLLTRVCEQALNFMRLL